MNLFNFNIEAEGNINIDDMSKAEWIAFKDDLKSVLEKYKLDICALYVYDVVDPKDLTDEEKSMLATQALAKKIAHAAMANVTAHELKSSNAYVIPNTSRRLN